MDSLFPGDQQDEDALEETEEEPEPLRHHYVPAPIDFSYRIVMRTILWLIAGAVFVGFAIWWVLT